MLGEGDYPLKGLVMAAANPAVTNPNTRKVEKALSRLELLVVNDFFLTPTARLAHYVLPGATFLEREELHFYPNRQMVNIARKIAEVKGVPPEYRMWRDLAHRLGFGEKYFPWESEEAVNRWILEPTGISPEFLKKHPRGYVYKPIRYRKHLVESLPTATGKLEFASPYLRELGMPEIPEYEPPYYIREHKKD